MSFWWSLFIRVNSIEKATSLVPVNDNPELYSRNVQIMVVKRVPGSKRARVEQLSQIKCFLINFLKVVIAVDVLMETNNEFLQQKMPSSRECDI